MEFRPLHNSTERQTFAGANPGAHIAYVREWAVVIGPVDWNPEYWQIQVTGSDDDTFYSELYEKKDHQSFFSLGRWILDQLEAGKHPDHDSVLWSVLGVPPILRYPKPRENLR